MGVGHSSCGADTLREARRALLGSLSKSQIPRGRNEATLE